MTLAITEGGVLFVVATPIGNLEDITARALRVLREVDLIACEDTRRTGELLRANGISNRTVSYFEHNEERRARELVERLKAGARVALVTDAGTPGISDPGFRLVRGALEAGIRVIAIPGPSAATAALSIAGLPTDRFVFEGFLPGRPAAKRRALEALRSEQRTMVFFEAGRRLEETLAEMARCFGSDREAAVVREISKVFEETVRGSIEELRQRYARAQAKGEVTLVVGGCKQPEAQPSKVRELTLESLMAAGLGLKQASKVMAGLEGKSSRGFYQQGLWGARLKERG